MRNILVGVMVCLFVATAAVPAFAEGFFDMFAGASFGSDATVNLMHNDGSTTSGTKNFSGRPSYGLRAGAWLKPLPWLGVGGDFSSLHVRGNDTNIDLIPMTPMIYFRLPLQVDEEVPQGWVQPYAGIGPSLALYSYVHTSMGTPNNSISATGSNIGFQLPVGLNIQMSRRVALLFEYRYAFYKIDVDRDWGSQSGLGISNSAINKNVKIDLSLHNIFTGLSFHF